MRWHRRRTSHAAKVDDRALERLIALVKHHEVHINATNDFEQSQATAGGVDTREIEEKNMASKNCQRTLFYRRIIGC